MKYSQVSVVEKNWNNVAELRTGEMECFSAVQMLKEDEWWKPCNSFYFFSCPLLLGGEEVTKYHNTARVVPS